MKWNTTLEIVRRIISSDVNWSLLLQQRRAFLRVRVVVVCGYSECISCRIVIVVTVEHRWRSLIRCSTFTQTPKRSKEIDPPLSVKYLLTKT